jgi:hypothetical protein
MLRILYVLFRWRHALPSLKLHFHLITAASIPIMTVFVMQKFYMKILLQAT